MGVPTPTQNAHVFARLHKSHTACLLFLSDLRHSHANHQDVKGCDEGVKALKSPNGVPPSDSPRLLYLRNLVQTSRVNGSMTRGQMARWLGVRSLMNYRARWLEARRLDG